MIFRILPKKKCKDPTETEPMQSSRKHHLGASEISIQEKMEVLTLMPKKVISDQSD